MLAAVYNMVLTSQKAPNHPLLRLPNPYDYTTFVRMKRYTTVLTLAGSDCSGGAGIQADIKTISALGGYAAAVTTVVTSQNTTGIKEVYPLPAQVVESQLKAITDDMVLHAAKIGMIVDGDMVYPIAAFAAQCTAPVVYDPILKSSSGYLLLDADTLQAVTQHLIPHVSLLTPNIPEASLLADMEIRHTADMEQAARIIVGRYHCRAVLVKGGHGGEDCCTDVLLTDTGQVHLFSAPRIASRNTHGTGCTLSAAIATYLAHGAPLHTAVEKAKAYLSEALQAGAQIALGKGHGPLAHCYSPIPMQLKSD